METLTLEIKNPATIQAIAAAAAQQGVPAREYALELLETALLTQRPFEASPAKSAELQAFLSAMAEGSECAPVLPLEANERTFYYEEQD